jgi:Domain of unknown function (DUF3883)
MKDIYKFEAEYDSSHEDKARKTRGIFLGKFPVDSLRTITLEDYVVGHGTASFCNLVESGTRAWANIQGATSFKFGIYYGKEKHDPLLRYRFARRFGSSPEEAFANVKEAVIELVEAGRADKPDFAAIDANPLSQMFKAKILSLYYPKRFIAVCSSEHLEMLGDMLGFAPNLPASQYQNLLLEAKRNDPATRRWSEPKFMAFLYRVYVRVQRAIASPIERPKIKRHRSVDFDELQRERAEIGRIAEEFALEWEKARLRGSDLKHLANQIDDRRSVPSYGHDFRSFTSADEERFIEVKCVAKVEDGHRFFLSENELQTSRSKEHSANYYFYLVYFDGKRNPVELEPMLAKRVYVNAEMIPSAYEVRFDRRKFSSEE